MKKKASQHPLAIEFFGLPGSGKTTTAQFTGKLLKGKELQVIQRDDIRDWLYHPSVFRKSLWFIRYLSWAFYVLGQTGFYRISNFKDSYFRDGISSFVLGDIYLNTFSKKNDSKVFMLDQWSIQYIWSAYYAQPNIHVQKIANLFGYSNRIYSKKYIYFKLDTTLAAQRILQRKHGNSRFDHSGEETLIRQMIQGEKLFEKILLALQKKNTDVFVIDASLPAEHNAIKIADWISDFALEPC